MKFLTAEKVYFCRLFFSSMKKQIHNTVHRILVLSATLLLLGTSCRRGAPTQHPAEHSETVSQHTDTLHNASNQLPDGFCYLTDSIPDLTLDIRYYSDYNFVGTRIDGYEAPVAILTCQAASALRKAADELRTKGYRLKIYDAYRPQSAVDHFVRWAQNPADTAMKHLFYPDIPKDKIFSRGFVATKSSHTRGSTVDLTIVHARTGKDVDMGSPFDFFGDISHTDYEGITKEQHDNRMLLKNTMVKHGFQPIRGEWWHFTLRNEPFPETYFDFKVVGGRR